MALGLPGAVALGWQLGTPPARTYAVEQPGGAGGIGKAPAPRQAPTTAGYAAYTTTTTTTHEPIAPNAAATLILTATPSPSAVPTTPSEVVSTPPTEASLDPFPPLTLPPVPTPTDPGLPSPSPTGSAPVESSPSPSGSSAQQQQQR